MNKEILKAIEEKQKKHPFRDWWNSDASLKTRRIIFFPIWIYVVISDKIKKWNYDRTQWDEKRADEILNYYIPRESSWNSKDKHFWFFDNGMGWYLSCAKKSLKRKDYRFWKKFAGSGKIREYLIDEFELEGFEKEVLDTYDWYTEIIFRQKS